MGTDLVVLQYHQVRPHGFPLGFPHCQKETDRVYYILWSYVNLST